METIKLMLVDDEERFLITTSKLLAKKGYEVITAASGAEALKQLQSAAVHVVILDVKMPGMDGITTLREIKRLHPMVEVIMLTGHATVETAIDGLKSGAFDYLLKPSDLSEIIDKAQQAFARRQLLEERIRVAKMRHLGQSPREILKDLT